MTRDTLYSSSGKQYLEPQDFTGFAVDLRVKVHEMKNDEPALDFQATLEWLLEYRHSIDFRVERISFLDSKEWSFEADQSSLGHRSGKFYRVCGYRGSHNGDTFYQPLIDQPETGTQGFVIRRLNDEVQLLVQARTEPGNLGVVQIGPTIQATFSNYSAVHAGKAQPFLELFHHPDQFAATIVVDTVQPELGTKFFKKWNRNIVIETTLPIEFDEQMFQWVSLSTLCELMQRDHIVNNDARLVVGLLLIQCGEELFADGSSLLSRSVSRSFNQTESASCTSTQAILTWIESMQPRSQIEVKQLPLCDLPDWEIADDEIRHKSRNQFSVIQVKVHAADREVTDWDQPLLTTSAKEVNVLVCQEHAGVMNFLFHAASQIGNANGVQLQPSFSLEDKDSLPPEELVSAYNHPNAVSFKFEGSDEGGRFYQYINRYHILNLPSDVSVEPTEDYCWLTLQQIRELINTTELVSDESRSILSLFLSAVYFGRTS